MKKLKLKALELGVKEVLTREQLKNVLAGAGDGSGGGGGCGCPQNTYVCYCYSNNQFSCVYGGSIVQAMNNFQSVCSGNANCSTNWSC